MATLTQKPEPAEEMIRLNNRIDFYKQLGHEENDPRLLKHYAFAIGKAQFERAELVALVSV